MNLNRKIRRRGTISAFEIHTSRDLHTGQNLELNDHHLRSDQLKNREAENSKTKSEELEVLVGDTVLVNNRKEKHKAKDVFIVTAKKGDKTTVQKVLHPFDQGKGKFMSKAYTTDQKRLKTIHRPKHIDNVAQPDFENITSEAMQEPVQIKPQTWSPIDKRFFARDEDSDDQAAEIHPEDMLNNDDDFFGDLFASDGENEIDETLTETDANDNAINIEETPADDLLTGETDNEIDEPPINIEEVPSDTENTVNIEMFSDEESLAADVEEHILVAS
jgi:hypothetical protein